VTAESIFQGSDRRMELNKAYVELINTMFVDSTKTPRELMLFGRYLAFSILLIHIMFIKS
jgi:hypothetical protein